MADSLFSRLEPFDCQRGDFDYYLEQFDNYLLLNSVQDSDKTVPLFISSIGQDAYKILREICDPVDPKEKSFEQLKTLLQQYFARRTFFGRSQRPGEYTGAYVNEMKRLVAKCNFGPFAKEALRDRIACGKLPEDKTSDKNQPRAQKQRPEPEASSDKPVQSAQKQKPVTEATSSQKQKKVPKQPAMVVELVVPVAEQKQKGPTKGQQHQQHQCRICGQLHQENQCPYKPQRQAKRNPRKPAEQEEEEEQEGCQIA